MRGGRGGGTCVMAVGGAKNAPVWNEEQRTTYRSKLRLICTRQLAKVLLRKEPVSSAFRTWLPMRTSMYRELLQPKHDSRITRSRSVSVHGTTPPTLVDTPPQDCGFNTRRPECGCATTQSNFFTHQPMYNYSPAIILQLEFYYLSLGLRLPSQFQCITAVGLLCSTVYAWPSPISTVGWRRGSVVRTAVFSSRQDFPNLFLMPDL